MTLKTLIAASLLAFNLAHATEPLPMSVAVQGNPLGALNNLEKATQVQPDSREAHLFLADAYAQLGRVADAQNERAAAQKLASPPVH